MGISSGEPRALAAARTCFAAELREQVFLIVADELRFGGAAERLQIKPSRARYRDGRDRDSPQLGRSSTRAA
jgi:hypothetical protein